MKTENMGWQCPNCLVVYSPSVEKCECSAKVSYNSTVLAACREYVSETVNGICSKCGQPIWSHYNISYT